MDLMQSQLTCEAAPHHQGATNSMATAQLHSETQSTRDLCYLHTIVHCQLVFLCSGSKFGNGKVFATGLGSKGK